MQSLTYTYVTSVLSAALAVFLILASSVASDAAADAGVPGLGYGPLGYTLPEPGSYSLSNLGAAQDGNVLLSSGESTTLHSLFDGRFTLLSFMYSSCSDMNGCPLAASVLHQVKARMQKEPALSKSLRLISMSFDPEFDTPERMRLYERGLNYSGDTGDWIFLTTESTQKLRKILIDYKQDIVQLTTNEPSGAAEISHLLRVYLIDREKQIRNIYSVSFLHADILIQDVKTLLLESQQTTEITETESTGSDPSLSRPGDDKTGYEDTGYRTNSLSLGSRTGRQADLLRNLQTPPLGLPPVSMPAGNPATLEKIQLGRKIFYDRRLSINGTFSCASCHVPEQGFTSNELATAVGVEGRSVRRNTMTIYNTGYATRLFHDGREENLEQQVWSPFLARNEMANPSIGYVLQKFRSSKDYDGLFESAFEGRPATMETVGMALATYQRTLVSGNSPFDRWRYGNEADALSAKAAEGFRLFSGKAKCTACHLVGDQHATFSNYSMHNTGLGYKNSLGGSSSSNQEVVIAPGLTIAIDSEIIARVSEKPPADVGLYEITENPDDRWRYRTPSLRNVALTAPYMHNGELSTLEDVVEFYNQGGIQNPLLDPLIKPLGLNKTEIDALVEFMHSLTGSNVDELVSDAFAAPIGDPGYQPRDGGKIKQREQP